MDCESRKGSLFEWNAELALKAAAGDLRAARYVVLACMRGEQPSELDACRVASLNFFARAHVLRALVAAAWWTARSYLR